MEQYLAETYFFDYSNDSIQKLIEPFKNLSDKRKIGGLFQAVRDNWRYNPYVVYTKPEFYRASFIASNPEGHCIDKSTLFIAGLRALGFPARLRLAKVANHIAVERLTEKLGTHYLAPHGIAEVLVNGEWKKASTAFNKSLCDRYKVETLDFDGSEDSIFQNYNRDQQRFMEYVEDYGPFDDVPVDYIIEIFRSNYPNLSQKMAGKERVEI